MSYQSVNPYDGKILKTFEELTDKQLETALKTAATCFETWRHRTFAERAAVVAKAAAIMHARVFGGPLRQRLAGGRDLRRGAGHLIGAFRKLHDGLPYMPRNSPHDHDDDKADDDAKREKTNCYPAARGVLVVHGGLVLSEEFRLDALQADRGGGDLFVNRPRDVFSDVVCFREMPGAGLPHNFFIVWLPFRKLRCDIGHERLGLFLVDQRPDFIQCLLDDLALLLERLLVFFEFCVVFGERRQYDPSLRRDHLGISDADFVGQQDFLHSRTNGVVKFIFKFVVSA